jgi:PadR family transcriptional regulator, regulatory protein PadR
MARHRSHSAQTIALLLALALDPTRWRYGYDLCVELGLKSGSLYPILIRLADRGFLESTWESADPGKPPRHVYRLTSAGVAEAGAAAHEARPATTRRAQLGPA